MTDQNRRHQHILRALKAEKAANLAKILLVNGKCELEILLLSDSNPSKA